LKTSSQSDRLSATGIGEVVFDHRARRQEGALAG
jgi:hypothetical protein